jgi:hypothetical protein
MAQTQKKGLDRETLVDVRDVMIDSSLPQAERIKAFISQIKNPYCFKVGDVIVNVSYAGNGATLNERFVDMLSMME